MYIDVCEQNFVLSIACERSYKVDVVTFHNNTFGQGLELFSFWANRLGSSPPNSSSKTLKSRIAREQDLGGPQGLEIVDG